MTRALATALAALLATAATAGSGEPGVEPGVGPYGATPEHLVPYRHSTEVARQFFDYPLLYRGPGREEPEPTDLKTVRLALLAPLEGTAEDEIGQSLKRGIDLAVAEANAEGGYRGLPFEVIAHNDQLLWGASSNTLVEMTYKDKAWAVLGSPDSNSTHVALRAALKTEILMVTAGASDPTVTETRIPWIVRLTPDDRQNSYRLARLLFEEKGFTRVAVLRASDRFGRTGIGEFRDAARRLRRPLPLEVNFAPHATDFTAQLDRLAAARAEALVIWANARTAGRLLRQMRARGLNPFVAGPDRLVGPELIEEAGAAAEGVVATFPYDPGRDDPRWQSFVSRFLARYQRQPDMMAAYGYDSAVMLIEGIREAGLNRARIRDRLCGLTEWQGVTGKMRFDLTSNNVMPPILARVESGRFVYQP